MRPKVLIGFSRCPITQKAFQKAGCDAWTCDLLPAQHTRHIVGDVWDYVYRDWDGAVFHPMCTYLTVSAAWAFSEPDFERYPETGYHQRVKPGTLIGSSRRAARSGALDDFAELLNLPYPVAVENPAPSFVNKALRPPDQVIQPYEFGDDASKRTGLWLREMPRLVKDIADRVGGRIVGGVERWANQTDKGQNNVGKEHADRWLIRSATYPGIARAMGAQWGRFLRGR